MRIESSDNLGVWSRAGRTQAYHLLEEIHISFSSVSLEQ